MDLKLLKPELSARIAVKNPVTGKRIKGLTFTLAGRTSPEFVAAVRSVNSESDDSKRGIDLFAAVILEWQGFEEDGELLPCDFETAKRLLTEYDWLLEQVIAAMTDKETFLPNARNASASQPVAALGEPQKIAA